MGYLFLTVSQLAGSIKGYCGKKIGGYATNLQNAVSLNLIRMSLCVIFAVLLVFVYNDTNGFSINPKAIAISALSGISTSVFVVSWIISVRKSAYMMLDVFITLGTLVPMIAGYFFFGENVSAYQWIGFFILVTAVIIMCSYNNNIKTKITIPSFMLLILCGFVSGLSDFTQKMFVKELPDMPVSIFNLYTYIFSTITLAVVYVFISSKSKPQADNGSKNKYVYVSIMSAALIANSYFKTKAAIYLDSAQLYPLNQGLALILSTLMASVFFKEKLTLKCVLGIFIAFIGILIMNVL